MIESKGHLYDMNFSQFFLEKVIYISRKINSFNELPVLLDSIMETATEILNSEAASVLLLDDKKENLIFYSVVGDKKEILRQFTVPSDKGIAGYTIKNKKPTIVNDVESDSRFYHKIDKQSQFKTRNIIAFPLIVKDEVIGVLEVINAIGREGFEEKDLKILAYIAELSALAIYNRVLYDNLEQTHRITDKRVQELNALYTILNTFSNAIDQINLREIFQKAGKIIQNTLDCNRVSLFLNVKKEKDLFEMVCGLGFEENDLKEGQIIPVEETRIMSMVEKFREPVYIMNEKKSNFSIENALEKKYNTQTFISLPILNHEKVVGFINVTEKNAEEKGFNDFDFSLLKSVGITLGNIFRQYEANLSSIQQKIMNRELETAATIQRKMLPQKFPNTRDIDMFAMNIPARNVSGDFYGFQSYDEDSMAVYIGDVSGKGLPAAFFMGTANTSLKEKSKFFRSPADVLSALNNTLFEEVQDGMFITLAYFYINWLESNICYSFAGHNSQFLFSAEKNEITELKTPGKPIGIMYDIGFNEEKINFSSGDILLLFTDGVTEALLNNREEEGENLLKEVLMSGHSLPARDLCRLIKSTFLEEGKDLFDDFTLVVIKF